MDKYGLTDHEKSTNLHDYNHALFRNMMYFLNIEWEINMLTETVVVLDDKNEPEKNGRELAYAELFGEYLNKYIDEGERETFCRYLQFGNLQKLQKQAAFDIHLRNKNGESELYNIFLTPAFDETCMLYCVYLGARNLQEEVRHELEEYHRQKQFLNVLLSNSFFHLSFDLTQDAQIRDDFVTKDGRHPVMELTGKKLPVSYEYFIQKWFERYEPRFDRKDGEKLFEISGLTELYRKNEHLVELEIKQKNLSENGIDNIMQGFIVLMKQPEDKHIRVYLILKDVSVFQKETIQDNMQLRTSNENLKNSLSQEQQYRLASLSGALLIYNINLTRNLIEEEFYEIIDEQRIPMLELVGLKPPCDFGEFCRRWCETKVAAESRETFLKFFSRRYMLEQYQKGERHLEIEFDTVLGRGILITLRNTAFLVEDQASGDILAMVNSKDVSSQRAEEKRQREELRSAYEAASNANTVKTDFLTRMSHDIRTPMNAIIGMTAIASKHLDNTQRVAQCLKEISSSGKYLLNILTEVLDMSRIEAGKLQLVEKEFSLSSLLDNISTISQFQCREKEHDFSLHIQELIHPAVIGDPLKLQQVIMYLIDNAIKYTPAEGSIRMTVAEKDSERPGYGRFEFVLADNGIGMGQDYLEQLFEPFVRAEDPRVSKIQGTGLGLPIVKSIVQMMDGEIDVQSELDKGTRITVSVFLRLQSRRT